MPRRVQRLPSAPTCRYLSPWASLEARRQAAASCAMVKVLIDHPWAAIAAVGTEMDEELAVLEQRQATPRALQQSMIRKPLTVRTRRFGSHATPP